MKKLYTTNFKNKVINLFNYFSILLLKDKFIKTYTRNVLSKYETPPMLINIGAGSFKHPLWINMDFSNEFYASVQNGNMITHDLSLRKDFPFGDRSVNVYYCSHVIEHLNNQCVQKMFDEVYRTLKKDGVFRLTCPDMEYLLSDVKNGNGTILSAIRPWGSAYKKNYEMLLEHCFTLLVHNETELDETQVIEDISKLNIEVFFNKYMGLLPENANKIMPHGHCNWFTFAKISDMLKTAGFSNINKSEFCKSPNVELRSPILFDNTTPEISIYIEARK